MEKVTTTVKEQALTESKSLRDEAINNGGNFDFLDKLKAIEFLTKDMILSIEQISNYYEVSKKTVETVISRNRDEFEEDGMKVLIGDELREFKNLVNAPSNEGASINSRLNSLTILSKRSLLRVGLIMTNNAMAFKIRNYLLNLEEVATKEQRNWALQREVGKVDRKRMTSAICDYLQPSNKFVYSNYTDCIYKILFGKKAKELRVERNVKTNDALRDSFSKEELKLVQESETIVTALVTLSFSYDYIKEQLQNKYSIKIEGAK